MKTLKILVAVVMPLTLAGAAHAAPPAKGAVATKVKAAPFALIKDALGAPAAAKLATLKGKVGACFKQHGKVAGKEKCRDARREFVRTQSASYKEAIAKAKGPLKAKLEKSFQWLEKRRAHLRAKAAAGAKAGTKAPTKK